MAKNGNGILVKWIGIIVIIALAVAGWIWNAATVCQQVKANNQDDARVHPKVEQHDKDITELKGDIKYIRETVDKIEKKL